MASVGRLRRFGCPDSVGSLTAGIGWAGSGLKGVVKVSAMPFMTPLLYVRLCGTDPGPTSFLSTVPSVSKKKETQTNNRLGSSESERFMVLGATARDSASRPLRLARPRLSEKHQAEN